MVLILKNRLQSIGSCRTPLPLFLLLGFPWPSSKHVVVSGRPRKGDEDHFRLSTRGRGQDWFRSPWA